MGIGLIKIQAVVVGVAGVTPSIIIVAGIIRSIMFVIVDVGGESLVVVAESVATSRNSVNAFHFGMPGGHSSGAVIEHGEGMWMIGLCVVETEGEVAAGVGITIVALRHTDMTDGSHASRAFRGFLSLLDLLG